MLKDYNLEVQKLFLEMMLQDAESYVRVQNIFNVENFDKSLRAAAKFIEEHSDRHKTLPDRVQIQAATGLRLEPIAEFNEGHQSWFMEEFEGFTKRQELERAILKAADLLEKGTFEPVEKLIKDAVQISLTRDMGTDYFADPRSRLMALKNSNGQNSTGWACLDKLLYGGFNRGELQIFAGGSGSGKSLFMQNLAVNWVQAGLNGAYITLELSEGLCSMRIDSMMTNTASKEIFKDLDTIEMKIKMMQKKSGGLRVKYMPAQSTVNDLRAYVKELQVQTGLKIDFLCVDYLDLLMPVSAKVSPNDLFVKDKYVSEELRNLAKELNVLFVTASQLNRSAVEEIEFDHSHISGGISKINTADNVFGIFTSRAMRERGRYQIQLMKTRSSSGVGQKVDLEFDVDSLRIRDTEQSDDGNGFRKTPNIYDSIKASSRVGASSNPDQESAPKFERATGTPAWEKGPQETEKVTADVQSAKLKQLLSKIKTGS
jgi:KaiC/GvpD/RAD55 family RecA-like ATPase